MRLFEPRLKHGQLEMIRSRSFLSSAFSFAWTLSYVSVRMAISRLISIIGVK